MREKNYKTINEYLPQGYEVSVDTTISEDNDIIFDICLYDEHKDLIDYFYATPNNYNEVISSIIENAAKYFRDKKIDNLLDGKN